MKLIHATGKYYYVTCEKCSKENRVLVSNCISDNIGYKSLSPVMCSCGETSNFIKKPANKEFFNHELTTGVNEDNDAAIQCPNCRSTQITANTKGFGLGKAAVGGLALGPVGLLGGLVGSKKIVITCLKCGHNWKAGQK